MTRLYFANDILVVLGLFRKKYLYTKERQDHSNKIRFL